MLYQGMVKTCTKCGRDLEPKDFSLVHPAKKDGRLRPDCKKCVRERSRRAYAADPQQQALRMKPIRERAIQEAKTFVSKYLAQHPCVDCGESDLLVLDFDHVQGAKICNVSRMVGVGYRLWRIQQEIEKCEVRCANCHRRATHKRRLAEVTQR